MRFRLDIPRPRPAPTFAESADDLTGYLRQSRLDDAATAEAKRAAELEERKANEYARQNELNEKRAAWKHEQDMRDRAALRAKERGGIVTEVQKRAREGGFSDAEAYAAATSYQDPISGETQGVKFYRQPGSAPEPEKLKLTEPTMGTPSQGLHKLFSGQLKLGGQAAPEAPRNELYAQAGKGLASMLRGPQKAPEEAEAERYGRDFEAYRGGMQDGERWVTELPGGQRVEFDPKERQRFQQEQNQERQERLMALLGDPSLTPDMKRAIATRAGLTGAGATGAEGAQIMGAESREDAQGFKAGQSEKYDLTADQKMEIARRRAAGRPSGPDGMTPAQKETQERGWHSQAETVLQRYQQSQGYGSQVTSLRGYEAMLDDLKSGNTAQMMGGIGAWVKEKSGGSAVITENEIKRHATSAIPWNERVEKEFNYWLKGGQVDQGYVKPFREALEKAIIDRHRGIIDRIGKGASAALLADPHPEVQQYADSAYTRLTTPLRSGEELDRFINEKKKGSAQPAAKASPQEIDAEIRQLLKETRGR